MNSHPWIRGTTASHICALSRTGSGGPSPLRSGDTAEALGWIETGRRLLSVVHGTFDTSLLVATRLVELTQRRAADRRLLKRFLGAFAESLLVAALAVAVASVLALAGARRRR